MKNVLITGAAGNLGTAVVDKFLSEKWNVIAIVDPKAKATLKQPVRTYSADLSNESEVNQVVSKIISENGAIDAALLLVGGFAAGNIDATDGAALRSQMSLNFETAYFTARPVFQQMMKQNGGRIVLVASKTALLSHVGKDFVAYSLSKFLLTKFAELLNAEGASKNVVCAVVAPSTIDTDLNRKSMPKADFSKWVRPSDIAESMFFLVSEAANVLRDPIFKVYGGA
jgi:NAD(P)-dependent dehydrogenase (short-subunit alcohol dehydrogenase family)